MRYFRYYWWRFSDDILLVLALLFVGMLMYSAYPVDPNALTI
jgi:hypothetical protein